MCALHKAVEHLIHGSINPTNFLDKGFDQKIAADATNPDLSGALGKGYNKAARKVIPIGLNFIPVVGSLAAAAYTAANQFGQTGKVGPSLLSGAANYAGTELGSSVLGDLGTVGNALGDTEGSLNGVGAGYAGANAVGDSLGQYLGSGAGNAAASTLSAAEAAPVSNIIGGLAAGQAADAINGGSSAPASTSLGTSAFTPSQAPQAALPGSLSSLSGLNPNQQASNLANKGTYGGGLGGDEQSYFLNLINRQLVDPSIHDSESHVNPLSSLSPIENSYLGNLGLGGYGNSNDLLQAISKWTTPQ